MNLPALVVFSNPDDVPQPDARYPASIEPSEQDRLIQQELLRRNDLASNASYSSPHRHSHW